MNLQLPDSTYKLLVALGIILMAYFYQDEVALRRELMSQYDHQFEITRNLTIDYLRQEQISDGIKKDGDLLILLLEKLHSHDSLVTQGIVDSIENEASKIKSRKTTLDSVDRENKLKNEILKMNQDHSSDRVQAIKEDMYKDRFFEVFGLLLFSIGFYCWSESERTKG